MCIEIYYYIYIYIYNNKSLSERKTETVQLFVRSVKQSGEFLLYDYMCKIQYAMFCRIRYSIALSTWISNPIIALQMLIIAGELQIRTNKVIFCVKNSPRLAVFSFFFHNFAY